MRPQCADAEASAPGRAWDGNDGSESLNPAYWSVLLAATGNPQTEAFPGLGKDDPNVLHLGSEFGVILNDPELRRGQGAAADRAQRSAEQSQARANELRRRLARFLFAVAVRIEPRADRASEARSSQPVFAD